MLGTAMGDCLRVLIPRRWIKRRRPVPEDPDEHDARPRSRVSFCAITDAAAAVSDIACPEFTRAELQNINEIEEVKGLLAEHNQSE